MKLKIVHTGLLIFTISSVRVSDGHSSDSCLECLAKISPEDGCVKDHIKGFNFCGPYRISEDFFEDCKNVVSDPDFRNCTTDYDCATECVKAWQDKYEDGCLIGRQRRVGADYEQLQCADYAGMHVFGHLSCAWINSEDILVFLAKQEPKCGCSTLYGVCTTPTITTAAMMTNTPLRHDQLLLLYSLVPCGVVILIVFIGCLCYLLKDRYTSGTNEVQDVSRRRQSNQFSEASSRDVVNRISTNNMYTTRSQQLYDYTLPPHNPFIPPQHRAPAVNPAFSPPEYSPQYEQPIPYHKTSAESLDKEELATSEIKASADTKTSSDELYVNTNNVRNISQSVGLHKIPKKSPMPAPRGMSKGSAGQPITYVDNVTIVDGYTV